MTERAVEVTELVQSMENAVRLDGALLTVAVSLKALGGYSTVKGLPALNIPQLLSIPHEEQIYLLSKLLHSLRSLNTVLSNRAEPCSDRLS